MKGFCPPEPEHLRRLLSATAPVIRENAGAPQAAVLLLIYADGKDSFIPLTLRSNDLPVHAGQICLPGGRVQNADVSLPATALREANEEIGVQLEQSCVLGCLPVTNTISGFEVTPVVAWTSSPPEFQLDPREVNALIALPLELALDLSLYKQDHVIENGSTREFYFIEFGEHYIWGATARILRSLACLVR
ncbi:MAG: CoA pyrophosphatase [Pseudomonadota bacterium]